MGLQAQEDCSTTVAEHQSGASCSAEPSRIAPKAIFQLLEMAAVDLDPQRSNAEAVRGEAALLHRFERQMLTE
jgi:hypothetical protein